ncbi:hypothetical protein AAFF_G00111640, partial [Aldrovandia affinis]
MSERHRWPLLPAPRPATGFGVLQRVGQMAVLLQKTWVGCVFLLVLFCGLMFEREAPPGLLYLSRYTCRGGHHGNGLLQGRGPQSFLSFSLSS